MRASKEKSVSSFVSDTMETSMYFELFSLDELLLSDVLPLDELLILGLSSEVELLLESLSHAMRLELIKIERIVINEM